MKPLRWLLLAACLAGVVSLVAWRLASRGGTGATGSRAAPAAVSVAPVARRTAVERVTVTGIVRPKREAEVVAKVQGRVEQVLVALGQPVKAGQLLAVVEHEEIGWQARQAQAAALTAEAGLENARQNLSLAETGFKRVQALKEGGSLPQAEFERVEAGVQAARTGVKAAEAQLEMARAAAGLAGQLVRNAELRSPIDGVVSRKSVDVAGQASQQLPPFQVQDLTSLKLEAAVEAQALLEVKAGQEVKVTSDLVRGAVFAGTVTAVSPGLDPMARRGTLEIAITPGEGSERLLPNQVARASVELRRRDGALTVPRQALVESGGASHVFVVRGGKAQQVSLRAPGAGGEFAFVEDELAEGEKVVVAGHDALFDGAPVQVTEELAGRAP